MSYYTMMLSRIILSLTYTQHFKLLHTHARTRTRTHIALYCYLSATLYYVYRNKTLPVETTQLYSRGGIHKYFAQRINYLVFHLFAGLHHRLFLSHSI